MHKRKRSHFYGNIFTVGSIPINVNENRFRELFCCLRHLYVMQLTHSNRVRAIVANSMHPLSRKGSQKEKNPIYSL